jgi:cytochrome c553
MEFFLFKSFLGLAFLLTAFLAIGSMLALMGRAEPKISAAFLRRLHKVSGFIFLLFFVVISYFCIRYWITAGDNLSTRAVLHGVLASGLFAVLLIKILIVQFYKQLIRFAPALGMIVFCLAFVVFSTSAGFYFLRALCVKPEPVETSSLPSSSIKGSIERGAALFIKHCSSCHYAESEEKRLGPGLKGLLQKDKLPHSGRPSTIENIKQQLLRPFLSMPSFANKLSEQDLADLLAYLKTL